MSLINFFLIFNPWRWEMKQKLAFSREKITREHKTALISLYSKVKKKTAPQDNVHIWDTCHNLLKKGGLDVYGYFHV